jgi:ribosome-associated heat shock protein Hsp15
MRARTDCAGLVGRGSIRINRQPTGKPHAKLRIGDVVTIPLHGSVRVLRVASLAARRGSANEARLLYVDLSAVEGSELHLRPEDPERRTSNPDDVARDVPRDVPWDVPRDVSDVSATSCITDDSSAYRPP